MRIIGIVLGLCLISIVVFADSSGEVVAIDKDPNGSIRVWVQYKIDGVEIESRYPKINGKSVFCSRFSVLSFAGMDDTEIKALVIKDADIHTQTLIRKTFIEKANTEIFDSHLKNIVDSTVTNETTIIEVDTNEDGVIDEKWIVKTNGTKIVVPVLTP